MIKKIPSKLDSSINYVINSGLEARFVQRVPEQVIVYLSSQYGCDQACRMCHLTQLGLTRSQFVTVDEFALQMRTVLQDYFDRTQTVPKVVNFNYMARGELLLNQLDRLLRGEVPIDLDALASRTLKNVFGESTYQQDIPEPCFNQYISTIFPKTLLENRVPNIDNPIDLHDLTCGFHHTFFYSLYSLDPAFRKRWLPNALDPSQAIELLWDYTNYDPAPVPVLHHALIEGENDKEEDAYDIVKFMETSDVAYRVNLVRYNPYSQGQGKEASDRQYERIAQVFSESAYCNGVQIVPRVGMDVKASCGTFLNTTTEQ